MNKTAKDTSSQQSPAAEYITLQAWAAKKFSPVPHANTLRKWAVDGTIVPRPFKVGRMYMVSPTARHRDEPTPERRLVHRLQSTFR
jgi:hypothetical protein